MAEPRVIIIGAGPAGVRAAEALVEAGFRPVVIDESARDGGQIYRRQPDGFFRPKAMLYGTEVTRAEALHARFDQLKPLIVYRARHLAWNIADRHVHVAHEGAADELPYDALIIASGATDRLMPVKGWHFAGTYSLGAAQIALKAQAVAIGRRVVFMGTGPLLHLVAAQYMKAGATVVAVLDTSPFRALLMAWPKLAARPDVLLKGMRLVLDLKRAGVQVFRGVVPVEIHGDPDGGVTGVSIRLANGDLRHFDCDAVGLGYHLRPETQLADLAGVTFAYDGETRQFLPVVDANGRSTVSGVYLAGDGCRVLGADAAEIAGRLAACAVLSDLRRPVDTTRVATLRRDYARMERFRSGLAAAFPWPHALAAELADETVVCRCEGIRAGELRAVATDKGAKELNRAKALSRVGMGRCQGRYCGHAAAEIVAHAAGIPIDQVGRLRTQDRKSVV
jgi:NADPH-dependent 2,4-dienoyl-CoA reductase/sulfur reductase-like enzyme